MGHDGGMNDEVRVVQPRAARKRYLCPACDGFIEPGTFHYVVIPDGIVDLRRHWHRGCWEREAHRRDISPW
jgi:hypothetical protein